MQNAAAWYQLMQLIGSLSFRAGTIVHVASSHVVRAESQSDFERSRFVFHAVSQPLSKPPSLAARPLPERRWVCLPDPRGGVHPLSTKSTKLRNRPTVTSYLSRRKVATAAWNRSSVKAPPSIPS